MPETQNGHSAETIRARRLTGSHFCSRIFAEQALTSPSPGRRLILFFILLVIVLLSAEPSRHRGWLTQSGEWASAADGIWQVQQILRGKAGPEALSAGKATDVKGAAEAVLAPDLVHLFYAGRGYRPAWIGEKEISSQIRPLLQALKTAETDGLDPSDYHLTKIEGMLKSCREGRSKRSDRIKRRSWRISTCCAPTPFLPAPGISLAGKSTRKRTRPPGRERASMRAWPGCWKTP